MAEEKQDPPEKDAEAQPEEDSEQQPEAAAEEAPAPEFDPNAPPRWAADEPTAMWDDSAMRDEGYKALAEDRSANPRAQSAPATDKGYGGEDNKRVKVSPDGTGGHPAVSGEKPRGGVSWPLTIGLSIALAVVVFLLVRFLR